MFLIEKTPREETTVGIDLSGMREIRAGEKIRSIEITAVGPDGSTADVLEGYTHVGAVIRVRLWGGEEGKSYRITLAITTNALHVREVVFVLSVRNKK